MASKTFLLGGLFSVYPCGLTEGYEFMFYYGGAFLILQHTTITSLVCHPPFCTSSSVVLGHRVENIQIAETELWPAFMCWSFCLWMKELGQMHGRRRLCAQGRRDSRCTEVWAVKAGSCRGNTVKQKDDVFLQNGSVSWTGLLGFSLLENTNLDWNPK